MIKSISSSSMGSIQMMKQKRKFRRKAKDNYKLDKGLLYYHQRGSSELKQVPQSWKDGMQVQKVRGDL